MSNNDTQERRLIAVDTPLGKDLLLLTGVYGEERISGLFDFQLEMLSKESSIDPKKIVGKPVNIGIKLLDRKIRYINGYVSSFSTSGSEIRGLSRYRAEVVPWLWFLTRTADCRIFQKKSIPEILEEVFKDVGFTDFDDAGIDKGSYEKWDYCVQYRETDFNFVSRLMEQVGIFYWFRHEKGKHTLVLADKKSAYKDCAEKEVGYTPGSLTADHIGDWQHQYELKPGKWAQTDYNFETPRTDLSTSTPTLVDLPDAKKYEIFDYPGEYAKKGEGETLTKVRMEEEEAGYHVVNAASACRTFTAGHKFKLTRHDLASEKNKSYLITRIEHNATDESYVSGSDASPPEYSNSFSCIPVDVLFRPPRTTPKPLVQGPQTAVVVGPKGEEIYTDKYGRVKVQFHWDRYSKTDESSSCWIRVSQPWGGKRWGWQTIPRIGQEVVVEFLEGDPDRPIITGSLYNADCMHPYPLPDNATMTALKSNSSKGGGGFNEIRFEDKKGKEQVFVHAERNQDLRVKNDTFEWIGNERHLIVKTDQLEQVDGDKHLTVKGDSNAKVSGTVSLDAAMDLQQKVGMNHALDAGMEIHLKGGMNVVIEAGMSITLKAGGGFVVVGPAGVTISGTPVLINSGGSAGSGSGCSPDAAKPPKEAATAKPGEVAKVQARSPPPPSAAPAGGGGFSNPQAQTMDNAARDGTPFCEKCEAARKAREQKG